MNERPGVVACECNNHPTATTVRSSPKKKDRKKNKADVRSSDKVKIDVKSEKNRQDNVKAGKVVKKEKHTTAENQDKKTSKKPDELHQHILAFPENDEILHFKSKN